MGGGGRGGLLLYFYTEWKQIPLLRTLEDSGWGARVCLWQIHFDIYQNQYNIVKFKNKIKKKKNS